MSKYHTPGPWQWRRFAKGERAPFLEAPHSGLLLVMDFIRRGMNGAQPRFATWDGKERGRMGGIMVPADKLNLAEHPDAKLIAAAPDLLAACVAALTEINRLQAALTNSLGIEPSSNAVAMMLEEVVHHHHGE
jgi:hypothetical protein